MAKKLFVGVSRIMQHRGLATKDLADRSGLAYNTILLYRRDAMSQVNKQTLESMAECLDVEPWEFFYNGSYGVALAKIARAVGVEDVADPVTSDEYRSLFMKIGEKVGAQVSEEDFAERTTVVNWV